jgi:hypothetical protein
MSLDSPQVVQITLLEFLNNFLYFIRLPFIENVEYIDLRRKIIKALVQIRVLIRNLRLVDQINMPKSKLILEVNFLIKIHFND